MFAGSWLTGLDDAAPGLVTTQTAAQVHMKTGLQGDPLSSELFNFVLKTTCFQFHPPLLLHLFFIYLLITPFTKNQWCCKPAAGGRTKQLSQ